MLAEREKNRFFEEARKQKAEKGRKKGRTRGEERKGEGDKAVKEKTKKRKGKKTLHAVGGGLPDVRVYKVIDIEFELYDQRVT